ncbi:MAG: hypothetical protein WCI51_06775 [Lentisphaerota bacterium]
MAELKYDASFPQQAREYAEQGMNNAGIAKLLGISQDSFYVYLRRFPEFAEAVETGRQIIADSAGVSLMDLAMGRVYVTTSRRDAGGGETRTCRQKAPDLKAIIKWLERNKQHADDGAVDDFADVQGSEVADMPVPANMKYERSFSEEVEFHAANGDTDDKISRRMNISPATFYNYKKLFPAFAAALARGRRECYGRLRSQLLSLALGKCGITTETVRDGQTRKTVERLLPPNLTAIKYWLADGCPAGYAGRMGETAKPQTPSKVSECGESEKSGKPEKQEKWKAGTNESDSAQRVSKVSECGESEKSGKPEKQEEWKAGTNEHDSVQRAFKVSESVENTGKTGNAEMPGIGGGQPAAKTETAKPQTLSKVSESAVNTYFPCIPRPPICSAKPQRYSKMSRKERQRMMKRHSMFTE